MAAVFGAAHVDDIASLRQQGHDPIFLEEEVVSYMFGGRIGPPPANTRYVLVVLPRPVLEIVTASDKTVVRRCGNESRLGLRLVKD